MVCVNFETHKSAPIPEEKKKLLMQEVLANSSDMKLYTFSFPNFEVFKLIPPNSFSCRLVVKNTEMDEFNHVTQNFYIEYANECAAQASAAGFYTKLKGDIHLYLVKACISLHVGESSAGDEVTIRSWEDLVNPYLLYFSISKGMKERICLAQIEYFDTTMYSHL